MNLKDGCGSIVLQTFWSASHSRKWSEAVVMSGGSAMEQPADMTDAQLRAALLRLSLERMHAGSKRREVIGRVCDAVLDELNARRADVSV